MNNLTKNLMTIAITGSLFLGSALFSYAADFLSTSSDTTRTGEIETRGADDLYFEGLGGPGDENPLPGVGPETCAAYGKITKLFGNFKHGYVSVGIHNPSKDMTKYFKISNHNDYQKTMPWDLLKQAWLQDLTVEAKSFDGECVQTAPLSSVGGELTWVKLHF